MTPPAWDGDPTSLLRMVVAEMEQVLESEYGTGSADPHYAEKWPAWVAAVAYLECVDAGLVGAK